MLTMALAIALKKLTPWVGVVLALVGSAAQGQGAVWPDPVASYRAVAAGEGRAESVLVAAAADSAVQEADHA